MVRIIDSDAINKRVFADIANTFQHSQKITGENTVQNFGGSNDTKAAAMDNFNFNGIEFSKIKQLINSVQTHKKEFKFDRQLVEITNNKTEDLKYFETQQKFEVEIPNPNYDPDDPDSEPTITEEVDRGVDRTRSVNISRKGVIINNYKTEFLVPDNFDGRSSFVVASYVLVPRIIYRKYDGSVEWSDDHTDTTYTFSNQYAVGQTEEILLYKGAAGHTWDFKNLHEIEQFPSRVDFTYTEESVYPFFYKQNVLKSMRSGLTEKRNIFDHKEFIRCWAASMDDSDGNNCMIIDKAKNVITITSSLNLSNKNTGFDREGDSLTHMGNRRNEMNVPDLARNNCIDRVYLDIFFMYWRDK